MLRSLSFFLVGALVGFITACEPAIPNYGPVEGCTSVCGNAAGGIGATPSTSAATGTGGAGGSGGGSGASTGSNTIQGTVGLVASDCFTLSGTGYTGSANVNWQSLTGASGTAQALTGAGSGVGGGTTSQGFDFTGVPGSSVWMFVQDTSNGAAGILSTLSYLALPQVAGVQIPVVESSVLQGLAETQPGLAASGGLNTAATQLVLTVTENGAPYQGLALTGGFGGGTILYDEGACAYGEGTSTGAAGVIVVLNANLSGSVTLTVQDTTTNATFSIPGILTSAGAVTLASADLM